MTNRTAGAIACRPNLLGDGFARFEMALDDAVRVFPIG
jgi:hypothetical protein